MDVTTLETRALQHFNDLLKRDELLWADTAPVVLETTPFDFEFRVAPATKQKSILAANAKGRSEDTDPFGDDDPAFTIASFCKTHTLRLNKFCVVRPQFVLHTTEFERQSDFLFQADFVALWQAFFQLRQERYAGVYNCGAQAGSSIGHKHMQIVPRASRRLFPDDLALCSNPLGTDEQPSKHHLVPFEHAILPVARDSTPEAIFMSYQKLCGHLGLVSGSPHNVFLTNAWIIVIPRSQAKVDNMAANAASMLGMVWVKNESELQSWKEYGPMNVLQEVGIRWEMS